MFKQSIKIRGMKDIMMECTILYLQRLGDPIQEIIKLGVIKGEKNNLYLIFNP